MRLSIRHLSAAAMFAAVCAAQAQNAPAPGGTAKLPAYDVVSVKPNKTGSGHVSISVDDGNYTAENVSLLTMIESAYGYKRDQVVGLEGPMASAAFDIRAKILEPDIKALDKLSNEDRQRMLRPILEQRFHLKFHTEMRTLPVYELVQAKGGSKLVQTSRADGSAGDGKTFRGVSSGSVSAHTSRTAAEWIGHDVSLRELISNLSAHLRRSVIDRTGLTGKFDIWLRWTPEEQSASMDKASDNGSTADAPPNVFTAIEEQLGLRLQATKAPIEVMVIDSVSKPDED